MDYKVLKQIGDEIRKAKYFSLMLLLFFLEIHFFLIIDSRPDIAHVNQLTLVIRYVLETGEPFLRSVGHKAEEMFSAIILELKTLGINIEDCRGQSHDNKKAVAEAKQTIQSFFKKEMGLLVDTLKAGFGNSNDGNMSRRLFADPETSSRIRGIDLTLIDKFNVILEVISSGYRLNFVWMIVPKSL